jgi:glucans biosynthesis protein C
VKIIGEKEMKSRVLWIDYLRACIIILVVAHHSALAYTTFAKFNKEAYILSSHPVVDVQRFIGLDIFVYFNDIFFMSLMFFISGLFLLPSLQKKGSSRFLRERFNRLFIPFLVGVTLLSLIAYYPAYFLAHARHDIPGFIVDFFTVESWPPGPPWFLWVLFFFNLVFVLVYPLIKSTINRISESLLFLMNKPVLLIVFLYIMTWILYVPMRLLFGAEGWISMGPFDVQTSRIFLYFGYFLTGVLVGNIPFDKGLLSGESSVMRKWRLWILMAFSAFMLLLVIDPIIKRVLADNTNNLAAYFIYCSVYVASCTFSCIAFLSAAKALIVKSNGLWDSLTAHSFTIYLIHYAPVVWMQYCLLNMNISAVFKFAIVFMFALLTSWMASAFIQKNRRLKEFL